MTQSSRYKRRRRFRGEKGYILAMSALLIVPLVVFTAFGVDLGAWYAQGAKQQRATDAAALAGVVQLPTTSKAVAAAQDSLTANGYSCTLSPGTVATSTNTCVYSFPTAAGEEMAISLWQPAQQYFSSVVLNGESLTRSATAVYNLHIPLGSPNNIFGNNLPNGCTVLPTATGWNSGACSGQQNPEPNLFAAIQGPYSRHQDGDPYATMCSGDTQTKSTCNPALNTQQTGGSPTYKQPSTNCTSSPPNLTPVQNCAYNPNGYLWAIDVKQAGQPVTVQIYDPANGGTGNPLNETLDTNNGGTFNTSYELFNTTGSSANIQETQALSMKGNCSTGPGWANFTNGSSPPVGPGYAGVAPYYTEAWYTLCTFTPSQVGIYPLEVKTSDITNYTTGVADSGAGWNVYSVRAKCASCGASTQAQVYALDSMSIWTASSGTTAAFYLANIGQQYAGHTLQIFLYDPGDGSGPDPFTMQFVPPPSGLGVVPTGTGSISCNYNSTPSPTQIAPSTPNTSANCQITTKTAGSSTGVYNGNWLNVIIQLPSGYTCSTDCWWWVKYTLGTGNSTPTDRTTWVVNVLGDPVHLVG